MFISSSWWFSDETKEPPSSSEVVSSQIDSTFDNNNVIFGVSPIIIGVDDNDDRGQEQGDSWDLKTSQKAANTVSSSMFPKRELANGTFVAGHDSSGINWRGLQEAQRTSDLASTTCLVTTCPPLLHCFLRGCQEDRVRVAIHDDSLSWFACNVPIFYEIKRKKAFGDKS